MRITLQRNLIFIIAIFVLDTPAALATDPDHGAELD
jgi:hypothetical protein